MMIFHRGLPGSQRFLVASGVQKAPAIDRLANHRSENFPERSLPKGIHHIHIYMVYLYIYMVYMVYIYIYTHSGKPVTAGSNLLSQRSLKQNIMVVSLQLGISQAPRQAGTWAPGRWSTPWCVSCTSVAFPWRISPLWTAWTSWAWRRMWRRSKKCQRHRPGDDHEFHGGNSWYRNGTLWLCQNSY